MKNQHPDLKYNKIIELVMTACGVGRRTVVETISHYKKTGNVYSPSKKRVKKTAITELQEEEIYAIRKHIDAFWERRELPTLAKILVAINEDINIPNMSMTTLRRVMKKMKFKYMQKKVSLIANTFSPKKSDYKHLQEDEKPAS